ncbi:MAG: universal stress protein [Methylotenera sp.]|nr:universal stress protein [Methylotenera sp.]MDP2280126.1 universal stress protein [Methylotenera sp.]MDP3060640.1 universal stress protein [Methylotenera sp.]
MQPFTHIIAATDFSVAAERAVRRAAKIARQLGAELHLIHVVHPMDLYLGSELSFGSQKYYEHKLQESGKSQLDTLAANLQQEFGIQPEIATRIGLAHTEIASYASNKANGLVVAGARGENESNLLSLLLGSTAMRLLRAATCPVLIVRNMEENHYRHVIATVDFSAGSAEVPTLARIAAPEAHIEILHIFELIQEARMRRIGLDNVNLNKYHNDALIEVDKKLGKILTDQHDNRMTHKIVTGYPATEICARATELPADLIVIGRHGMSGMQEWLLGSVSKNVSRAATCDVLVVNQHHEVREQ